MEKNIIFKLLIQDVKKNKSGYSEEDRKLFTSINEAIEEVEVARAMFNSVSEDQLIDLAIHTEDVAKDRLNYLIAVAKKRELKNIKAV